MGPIGFDMAGIEFDGVADWTDFYDVPPQFAKTPRPLQFAQNLWYSATEPPVGRISSCSQQAFFCPQVKSRSIVLVQYVDAHPVRGGSSCLSQVTFENIHSFISDGDPVYRTQHDWFS